MCHRLMNAEDEQPVAFTLPFDQPEPTSLHCLQKVPSIIRMSWLHFEVLLRLNLFNFEANIDTRSFGWFLDVYVSFLRK